MNNPSNLNENQQLYHQLLAPFSQYPCVYIQGNWNAPLTQDLLHLADFRDVYITDDPGSSKLKEHLNSYDDTTFAVVYVDVDEFWSSGFNAGEKMDHFLAETDYSAYEKLYEFGLSEVYVARIGS